MKTLLVAAGTFAGVLVAQVWVAPRVVAMMGMKDDPERIDRGDVTAAAVTAALAMVGAALGGMVSPK